MNADETRVMRFGMSTHLFHGDRFARAHVDRLAATGFDLVEVFATRTHINYHDAAAVAAVGRWLRDAHLKAWSVHLPICDGFTNGIWGRTYSNASADAAVRTEAIDEARAAVTAARDLGCVMAVLHIGIPHGQPIPPNDNDPGAVARSLEPIARACTDAGIRLALEVIPNALATPDALLDWLGGELDLGDSGVCLAVGHAHLVGGVAVAVESLSGHIITTHIHDNRGTSDDHLVPFDGTIDWPATMMEFSKVGYTGPLIFELPDHGDADRTLARAVGVRTRIQAILDELQADYNFEL